MITCCTDNGEVIKLWGSKILKDSALWARCASSSLFQPTHSSWCKSIMQERRRSVRTRHERESIDVGVCMREIC